MRRFSRATPHPPFQKPNDGALHSGVRACESAGQFGSCASACYATTREPTICTTGRNQPHFSPAEAFSRTGPFSLTFLPGVVVVVIAGAVYYRTCAVVEIRPTPCWFGHVHLIGGLGAAAARRSGLRGRACNTPVLDSMWTNKTPWQHRKQWPKRKKQIGGQRVHTNTPRISMKTRCVVCLFVCLFARARAL